MVLNVFFLICFQVYSRLHVILGDSGPLTGDITWHRFSIYFECDAAPPHVTPLCSGGSRPQLGRNLLGYYPDFYMVSAGSMNSTVIT